MINHQASCVLHYGEVLNQTRKVLGFGKAAARAWRVAENEKPLAPIPM